MLYIYIILLNLIVSVRHLAQLKILMRYKSIMVKYNDSNEIYSA